MAKINIKFNNKNYSIDPASLANALASLEGHLAAMMEERLEGDGAEFYTLTPTALSFRSTAPLNELQDIQINGVTVDSSNYTLEEGSTIVTFPIDYLKTLDVGNYEVGVVSESKTVKGGFTVAAPKLNNHGFYYNQPYSANLPMFGGDTALFVREDGTYDIITVGKIPDTGEYILDGNTIVATHPLLGTIHCIISSDGQSIYCTEVGATFALSSSTAIAADDDYVYVYMENPGGYEVKVIDKTKSAYGVIKTGINGKPTICIGEKAFADCVNLQSFTIPHFIQYVLDNAFVGCTSLKEVIVENCKDTQVYSLGVDAVINKKHIYLNNCRYRIKDNSTHIKYYSCEVCGGIDWSKGAIEQCEFDEKNICITCNNGAAGLYVPSGDTFQVLLWDKLIESNQITVSDGVVTGHKGVFQGDLIIPDSVTSIGVSAFKDCVSLKSVEIPDSVTSIGDMAFENCTSLTSIVIPNSVTSIGGRTFYNCISLTSIVIPDSVINIGGCAFEYCTSLNNIAFNGTMAQWNAIQKGNYWNQSIPATHVHCIDGDVAL